MNEKADTQSALSKEAALAVKMFKWFVYRHTLEKPLL